MDLNNENEPIERVWSVLENHWNGELLNTVERALGFTKTMTYNNWIGRRFLLIEVWKRF